MALEAERGGSLFLLIQAEAASRLGLIQALAPMSEVTIDFITRDPWRMVLVEQGPWEDVQANLQRIQSRLYTCLDAAIEGQLAEQFPDSIGAHVTLQLECYSLPQEQVANFFEAFSAGVLEGPDYKEALRASAFVSSIDFHISYA